MGKLEFLEIGYFLIDFVVENFGFSFVDVFVGVEIDFLLDSIVDFDPFVEVGLIHFEDIFDGVLFGLKEGDILEGLL